MSNNPSIYEINTRVWLRRFDQGIIKSTLADVPDNYWDEFAAKGIDYIWLMGVWKICSSSVSKYCFEEDLVKSYKRALKDWRSEDVTGSPFAICNYELNPSLCDKNTLLKLKTKLNGKGIKLILDLIPNHFNADSGLIKSKPEIFLQVDKKQYEEDPHTFYQPVQNEPMYFAHGRDPFFPAWQDTIQVNFFSEEARTFLTGILMDLTKICDGVRCDMAMLALNNVFQNTWGGILKKNGFEKPEVEFWKYAIEKIKSERPDFLFIAEAYWNLEWDLQQLGFDYTYDKSLTDRLKSSSPKDVSDHLLADREYQKKSLRFIENHDEERAIAILGKEKSKAAAVIISTIPGMHFYQDGQFEGRKIKLPVQLNREPEETALIDLKEFYALLLQITKEEIFKHGKWELLTPLKAWENNTTFLNIMAWSWGLKSDKRIVVVNYSDKTSTCRVKLDLRGFQEELIIKDLLNNQTYTRSSEEVYHSGLFIELKAYQSHIFAI